MKSTILFCSIISIMTMMPTMHLFAQVDSVDLQQTKDLVVDLQQQVDEMKPGLSSFMITGFTNLTYHQDLVNLEVSKFSHAGFVPIFLWKPTEKLFFEAELHIELSGGVHGGEVGDGHGGHGGGGEEEGGHEGSSSFDLGFANMVYMLNPYVIITAGKFLSPIGIFNERYHPTWINPLPINPLGMGHGGPLPAAELGIQARGGLQTGSSKVTYSIYLSNGPILNEGVPEPEQAGKLVYSNFSDNNANKAIGGRLSWLPLHNSSLELGVSGQYAAKTGDRGTRYEEISARIWALDYNYVKILSGLGLLRISGQYATTRVDDVDYTNSLEDIEAGAPVFYTFDNTSTFQYASISLRPIQSSNTFVMNSELIFRYETGITPEGSKWHTDESRIVTGYTYWLSARSALKAALAFDDDTVLYLQWALGF